MTNSEKI